MQCRRDFVKFKDHIITQTEKICKVSSIQWFLDTQKKMDVNFFWVLVEF